MNARKADREQIRLVIEGLLSAIDHFIWLGNYLGDIHDHPDVFEGFFRDALDQAKVAFAAAEAFAADQGQ